MLDDGARTEAGRVRARNRRASPVDGRAPAALPVKDKKGWTEAESLLQQNLDASYVPSRQFMAEWLAERGMPAEAVPHFEALLAAEPQQSQIVARDQNVFVPGVRSRVLSASR